MPRNSRATDSFPRRRGHAGVWTNFSGGSTNKSYLVIHDCLLILHSVRIEELGVFLSFVRINGQLVAERSWPIATCGNSAIRYSCHTPPPPLVIKDTEIFKYINLRLVIIFVSAEWILVKKIWQIERNAMTDLIRHFSLKSFIRQNTNKRCFFSEFVKNFTILSQLLTEKEKKPFIIVWKNCQRLNNKHWSNATLQLCLEISLIFEMGNLFDFMEECETSVRLQLARRFLHEKLL